jgi:hypothetical protein
VADTPDELLARATASGLVHGSAAARLTALFYEARFSSHPLDRRQRDAAEQALDELAAALAETQPAAAGAADDVDVPSSTFFGAQSAIDSTGTGTGTGTGTESGSGSGSGSGTGGGSR